MKDNNIGFQNIYNNNSNKPSLLTSNNKRKVKNLDNNISYSNSDDDKSENLNESNEKQNNDNSYNDESSQNKENEMNNSQKYNLNQNNQPLDYNNKLKNRLIKSVNNNIHLNKGISGPISQQPRRNFLSDKKISGYSDFFLNDKRAFSGEKNYPLRHNFHSTNKSKYNPMGDAKFPIIDNNNNENIFQGNYAPTYSNTKVMKLRKSPLDEEADNTKRNLNNNFYITRNNSYQTLNNNYYKNNFNQTSPNLKVGNYITNVKKLPSQMDEKYLNDTGNFNNINSQFSNNINLQNETNKEPELPDGNKTIGYFPMKKPFFSSNKLDLDYQRINSDNQPRLPNPNNFIQNNYSMNQLNNNIERKKENYLNDIKGNNYQNLPMNYRIIDRDGPMDNSSPMNFAQALKQSQGNPINPNNERKTIVKKLPPLNSINNFNNDDPKNNSSLNPVNRPPLNEQMINLPKVTPLPNKIITNNIINNSFPNKPNISVRKLENRVIPVSEDNISNGSKLNINNQNNFNKEILQNTAYNQINNPNINKQIINPPENQNQDIGKINRSFNRINQASNNALFNRNIQPQYQNDLIEENKIQINIQGNPNSNIENNKNIYLSNNQNQLIDNRIIPNQNSISSSNLEIQGNQLNNNININENIKENENNKKGQEKEQFDENTDLISHASRSNKVNISYNDFDGSGWVKNYGGVSRPGKDAAGKQKINQDSLVSLTNINNIKDFNIFGVLDGHGPQGHYVSEFASEFIPSQIINNPLIKNLTDPEKIYETLKDNNCQIITKAFISCDEQLKNVAFDSYNSGSTCTIIIHAGNHIICASTGDSRAIVVYGEEGDEQLNNLKTAQLSMDFKPEIPDEKNRILMSGGIVEQIKNEFGIGMGPYRVWAKGEKLPGLAMSRSIGDLKAKNIGVIPDPGIFEYDLNDITKYIVICSDGVWDYLNNEAVKDIGKNYYLEDDASQFCHQIINNAVFQWKQNEIIIDDITVVAVFF